MTNLDIYGIDSDFINFLIGGKLLRNVTLVSAIQQCESAIIIHIPLAVEPPSPASL